MSCDKHLVWSAFTSSNLHQKRPVLMKGCHIKNLTRRGFIKISSAAGAIFAGTAAFGVVTAQESIGTAQEGGFQAAAAAMPNGPSSLRAKAPGIQSVYALCEVTGGGQKVYGTAIEYDVPVDPAHLAQDTFTISVFPAAKDFFPGLPQEPNKNSTMEAAKPRAGKGFGARETGA